ncbi:hypothetical protein ACFU6I_14105 [Streptomyces sp. NPDC057486]|uniref:hypothetical protein n=1 Tax=Streptomyces sp. NPDC057486 TaxID=3346145 RepID=UPI00367FB951
MHVEVLRHSSSLFDPDRRGEEQERGGAPAEGTRAGRRLIVDGDTVNVFQVERENPVCCPVNIQRRTTRAAGTIIPADDMGIHHLPALIPLVLGGPGIAVAGDAPCRLGGSDRYGDRPAYLIGAPDRNRHARGEASADGLLFYGEERELVDSAVPGAGGLQMLVRALVLRLVALAVPPGPEGVVPTGEMRRFTRVGDRVARWIVG